MTVTMLSNILIVIGVVWIIAGYFTYMQTIKMNKVIKELGEKGERLYSGRNAGFMRTRRIAFVAATSTGTVTAAKVVKAAVIVKPSKVVPFDEIVGKNLHNLRADQLGLEPLMEKTMNSVLKDFQKRIR